MTFIRIKYLKIAGLVICVIAIAFTLRYQRNRNVSFIDSFYKQNINSVIKDVDRGSGGFYSIETIDGINYTFCPHNSFFEKEVSPGDSILKPAFYDSIRIYNGKKDLRFTFIKP